MISLFVPPKFGNLPHDLDHEHIFQASKHGIDYALLLVRVVRQVKKYVSLLIEDDDAEVVEKRNKDNLISVASILISFGSDGMCGTGKIFLYRALLGTVRSRQMIALATASSGVVAELFRMTKLIIWDEAPMVNRYVVEALDKMLRDVNDCEFPFGGKVIVLGGDFLQVLPVVQRGNKDGVIRVSHVNSYLWPLFTKLRLSENMRAQLDTSFCKYLLDIGDGTAEKHSCNMVQLPPDITIDFEEHITSLQSLIDIVYPNLDHYVDNLHYMINRVILTPKNEYVDEINNLLISHFPGDSFTYFSFDEAIDTTDQSMQED
ncbi:ATP-dependent DNA helicase PIF2-like [Olea europaea var. sylvestris]|uniref:ATP-dependent DNA helicase PIF2-like n=1 Tax=Olea europaea var. sylvestris TaxID=158386 RepID=UPI000C1D1BD7|nr:ATP-dependent DNA helicase PIF2-like [Olea europaea var. sylvestris]